MIDHLILLPLMIVIPVLEVKIKIRIVIKKR